MTFFQKAVKSQLKARVALDGPAGSGKTFTALSWARTLGDKIAVVDTERRSASYYADLFSFDTADILPPYNPAKLIDAFTAAEQEGYDVVIVDSLSHFWDGEGGFLDIADAAGKKAGDNSWAGWKTATPQLRHLVDIMLGSQMHVIVTMRSRTEWATEEYQDSNGRKKTRPVRLGLAPVMRAGMEYEFTVVGDLDLDHRTTISKTRCHLLADLVIQPGRFDAAEQFKTWLESGEAQLVDVRAAKGKLMDAIRRAGWEYVDKDRDCPAAVEAARIWNGLGEEPVTDAQVADLLGQVHAPGAGPSPDGPPESAARLAGPPVEGSPAETGSHDAQEGDPPGGKPETKKRAPARSSAERLHRELGAMGFSKEDQEELIFNESGGKTVHASELTTAQHATVRSVAQSIADGHLTMDTIRLACQDHRDKKLAGELEASVAGAERRAS